MNQLLTGDCLAHLPTLAAGSVPLVFADPPFNINYSYDEYDDAQPRDVYLEWAGRWVAECVRVLHPHGTLWLAICDDYAAEYRIILDLAGLHRRNWIIWHYTFGVYCPGKFGRDHTHLFYCTKHPKRFTWNPDAVRVPSARLAKYKDKRANPLGRVPGDVWTVPRVCGTFKERNDAGHNCQMPEDILDRIIRSTSNPGDLVVDPFAGTGTTLAVAKKLGRRYWGCELSESYAAAAQKRLDKIS